MLGSFRKGNLVTVFTSMGMILGATQAHANLTIDATFDSSITSRSDAATVEATLNSVISSYESLITDNVTAHITFSNMSGGLGQSSWYYYNESYSAYRAALVSHSTSAVDATVLANLPNASTDPVLGHRSISINSNLASALGFNVDTTLQDSVGLNLSIINETRTNIDPNKYDLVAVASHEIDEVLGFGSGVGDGGNIMPEDLFRYNADGTRSFTTNTNATPFFSIDGKHDLTQLNNDGFGDYGDWATGSSPQVQDAYGTPGVSVNFGTNERTLMDAIGYTLAPVPEPFSMTILGLGAVALLRRKRS